MKKHFFLVAFLTIFTIQAQRFDIKDFNEKTAIAEWLVDYDLAAWWSTDSLMTKDKSRINRIGKEWFCFQDSTQTWHSVYGKYENGVYDQVFHFIVKSSSDVKESTKKINSEFLNSHAKALNKAFEQSKGIRDSSGLRFNNYIRKNEKGNFNVYILPAFQPDGTAIYGGEFIYEITPENQIVNDQSYYQGNFRGFKTDPPREIWINYRELEKPSLGSVFFAWYYQPYFTKIVIDNKESFSTPFKGGTEWTWIHAEKDLKKEAKAKRKEERKKKKQRE
ncbi:hypothetical protein CLV90_3411 [Maribacter spongiicola]|uniref:Uncharacterized protein n=1 Tax=Maribacter spongiicola TaxID=1206753 RepID=A0A4R7JQT0_9FLAO|nr:hypothetical protein [Maribacter spongiicola]TDT40562.1 hypothetical protein CLV90_3411 [Maribacter spongiicola]